jgi:hypothetical protein
VVARVSVSLLRVVNIDIDAKLLVTNGDNDGLQRAMASFMVLVARRLGRQRRAIAWPELAVPAGLHGEIWWRGHEIEVELGCGERG